MVIHLVRYRVAPGHEVEVVSFLRHVGLHAAVVAPGVAAVFVGIRLAYDGREHIAVTLWGSEDAASRGIDASGIPRFLVPVARLIQEPEPMTGEIATGDQEHAAPVRVLRLTRTAMLAVDGTARRRVPELQRPAGCTGAWLASATNAGPQPETLAVSVWRSWETVVAATAGKLATPLAGLGEDASDAMSMRHYELVSDATR